MRIAAIASHACCLSKEAEAIPGLAARDVVAINGSGPADLAADRWSTAEGASPDDRMRNVTIGVATVLLVGCMNHGIPISKGIEMTYAQIAAPASLPRELHVVAFNVHREPGSVIVKALRSDPVLRGADLIVLEEIHRREDRDERCSGACVVAKELGFYAAYAPALDEADGTDGVAIVSRAPILSTEVIELPYFDVHINSGRRVAIAATILVDGAPATVYAVHLDVKLPVRDRRKQMMPVIEHAKRQTGPVIIAGDFNTTPFTWIGHVVPVLTTTQDDRLEELMRAHGFATPVKDSGATSRFFAMKLDAIYTRGFSTMRFATANAQNISDHLALWATMTPTVASRQCDRPGSSE
jgi:endonuclease/exonuclease/phosphatase family metal-dependent hydrolase